MSILIRRKRLHEQQLPRSYLDDLLRKILLFLILSMMGDLFLFSNAFSVGNGNRNGGEGRMSLGIFDRIRKDYLALTRRVTVRHILLSNEDVAIALKRKIRDQCNTIITNEKQNHIDNRNPADGADNNDSHDRPTTLTSPPWIVDIFESAAKKYSLDESTKDKGGLLGVLVPQGFYTRKSSVVDRACFETSSLGQIVGPIEDTTSGGTCYHLLLITERTNCPKLDGINTKLIRTGDDDIYGTLVPSSSSTTTSTSPFQSSLAGAEETGNITPQFIVGQITLWLGIFIAGGILSELLATK